MRVGQLWNWIYHYGVRDFQEMTTIGKGLCAQLAEHFSLDLPEVTAEQISSDGTSWSPPIAEGAGVAPTTVITFAPVEAKFVRITQTGRPPAPQRWSISGLRIYEAGR